MRNLCIAFLVVVMAAFSALAQEPAIPVTPPAAPAAAKPSASTPITDAQRIKVRELERNYYQLQNTVTQAQAAQLASQTAQEKMNSIRGEVQALYGIMQNSCKANEDFDTEGLLCKAKPKPAPAEKGK